MIRNGMFWGALGAFALALSLVATGAAQADSPNCTTVTVPVVFQETNPCNGELIAFTGSQTFTNCILNDASGGSHVSVNFLAQITGVGSLGNTYILNETGAGHQILDAQGNGELNVTVRALAVSTGAAPNFQVLGVEHETFSNFVVSNIWTMPLETDCSGNTP